MQILICKENDCDRYLDASTPEQFARSALAVLTARYNEGYWYLTPDEIYDPEEPVLGDEQIQALPASLQEDARRHRERQKREGSERAHYKLWYDRMETCVRDQDLSLLGEGEHATPVAYRLLLERREHEYEWVELDELEKP